MLGLLKITVILFTAFINFILGLLVLVRNPKHAVNRSFFAISILYSIWTMCLFFYDYPIALSSLFWIKATYLTVTIHEAAVLAFSFLFPKPIRKKTWKWAGLYSLLYIGFSVWLLYFTNLWITNVVIDPQKGLQTVLGPGYAVWLLLIWAALIWALINFIYSLRKAKGSEKLQLQFLFFGFALWGIAVNIPDVIIPLFFSDTRYFSISTVSSLFFTIAVAYSILKHRFFDIRYFISKAVAYILLLLTLGFAYAAGVLLIGTLFIPSKIGSNYLFISTILSLITALSFQPLRAFFEKKTANILYKDHYDAKSLLQSISKIMATITNVNSLTQKILKTLTSTIHISKISLFVFEKGDIIKQKTFPNERHFPLTPVQIKDLKAKNQLLVLEELKKGSTRDILRENDISVVLPLKSPDATIGLLFLGPKSSGETYYFSQDLEILEILGPELAIAIKNALSYEQIHRFNVTLKKKINHATRDLRKANRDLRHLDKLKDEFVFIATHELKSPVTAMRGYLEMLEEGRLGKVPKKMQEAIDQLKASNQQLVNLVNDLLQIARTEAQTLTIDTEPFNICEAIDNVIENLTPLADQKKITIAHICPGKEAIIAKADSDRVKEIANNLVSNSIKYSNKGTITITHAQESGQMLTHIADEGVGIAKADQKRIFTRFFRVEEEVAKGVPGTGLGLFIVKQLVERMGGKIWFTSTLGKGSTFSFSLPKAKRTRKTNKTTTSQVK